MRPPSREQWHELYGVAAELRRLAPWRWMYDSEIFGVRDPVSNEIGYCCVLGRLREVLGVVVYLGADGLATHEAMQSGEFALEQPELLLAQRCLMVTFDNKRALEETDLELVGTLGLKFHGPRMIPQFRSYKPGFLPWRLDAAEARFLCLALQQTIDMAARLKIVPSLLESVSEGYQLVRSLKAGGWTEEWQEPEHREPELVVEPIDELRVQRIRNAKSRRKGVWEVDSFYVPAAVHDERPYYPSLIVIVNPRKPKPLQLALSSPEEHVAGFQNAFLSALEQSPSLPSEIQVERESVATILEPIAIRLGIPLERVDVLRTTSFLRASLHTALMNKLEGV